MVRGARMFFCQHNTSPENDVMSALSSDGCEGPPPPLVGSFLRRTGDEQSQKDSGGGECNGGTGLDYSGILLPAWAGGPDGKGWPGEPGGLWRHERDR